MPFRSAFAAVTAKSPRHSGLGWTAINTAERRGRFVVSFYVGLQCRDVFGEGIAPGVRDAADRAGHLPAEGLFDFDVIRLRQLVQLYRKVARRGSGLLPDKDKVGALDPDEDRHHGQSQFRMQQRIQFFEHCLRVMWRRIKPGSSTSSMPWAESSSIHVPPWASNGTRNV